MYKNTSFNKFFCYSLILFLYIQTLASSTAQFHFPYQLDNPYEKHLLPIELREISGIVSIDSVQIACVQDEWGMVFIYNLKKKSVTDTHRFDSIGDFEGIAYNGLSLFVLRSDGRLTEWENFHPQHPKGNILHHTFSLLTSDNEGLCFDIVSNRLLMASKNKPHSPGKKNERIIYAININHRPLKSEVIFRIIDASIGKSASSFGIKQQEKSHKNNSFHFRPSGIAIHPISKHLYIISASDYLLAVFRRNGELLFIKKLNPDIFPKAEGITFLDDGTMLISNEGKKEEGNILTFRYN